ncbi:hypothetical protein CHUAL_008752 [Chamberlinius hualienensis]
MAAVGVTQAQEFLQKFRNIEMFRIIFDNPTGTYFAGRILTGKIVLWLKEPLKMKGVYIHVKGMSHVHIPDKDRLYDPYQTDTKLASNEIYFDIKKPLADTETRGVITSGHHEFPFSMDLPQQLPTSFEGQFGYIRYCCIAIISRPWRVDAKCKAGFTVISKTDLNRIAESENLITRSTSKRLRHMLKKLDPVTARISLDRSGYVSGQSIIVNAEIVNESSREVTHTVVALMSKVTYRSGGFYRQVVKPVCQTTVGSAVILPKHAGRWVDVPLKIPAIPPTSMGLSKNIAVTYFVQLKVVVSGIVASDLEVTAPICIGTVPLRTDFAILTPSAFKFPTSGKFFSGLPDAGSAAATASYLNHIWEQPSTPPPPPNYDHLDEEYPDLPPPSYELCVFGKVNIRDEEDGDETVGDMEFAPHYVMYENPMSEFTLNPM